MGSSDAVRREKPSDIIFGILGFFLLSVVTLMGQDDYIVGDELRSETLNTPMDICSNGSGSTTIGELLNSGAGEPRAVWISFFASW